MPIKGKFKSKPRRRRVVVSRLTKTPRPGGNRRGPQTQYTLGRVPPGYKVSGTVKGGKRAYLELKKSGATFVKTPTRKPPKLPIGSLKGSGTGYTPGGPSQYMIDHGYVVSKDTGQMLYDQMSKYAPAQQSLKKHIERQGNVAIWNDELNRWVTL